MTREANPTAVAEDPERLVAEARLLADKAATREQAQELLERVLQEAEGTAPAREALEVLRQIDALGVRTRDPQDEELLASHDEWRAIHGPQDGRLRRFLERLRQPTPGLEPLCGEVERDLGQWIRDQTTEMERAREQESEPEPRRLEAAVALADFLAGVPRFEVALHQELRAFRDELYGLRLCELRPLVERACRDWAIDEAWDRMKQLEGPPARFRPLVGSLSDAVYAAAGQREKIEDVLGQIPAEAPPVSGWPALRGILESIRETREHDLEEVPGPWRAKLRQARERLLAAGLGFLEAEAREARTLEDLRAFRKQYDHLRPHGVDARLEARGDWFDDALGHLGEELAERVAGCADTDGLAAVTRELEHELAGLPPCVGEPPWVAQLEKVLAAWRTMERGERFSPPTAEAAFPEMVPKAFAAQVERHLALLEEIDDAFLVLERPDARAREVLAVARRVLRQVPGHVEARRLEGAARILELRRELDDALKGWDPERFRRRAADPATPVVYRDLREHAKPLAELAAQTAAAPFASTHAAAAWWRDWHSGRERLPARLPPALADAVARHQRERQQQWRAVLEELLSGDPSPEECRAAAASLAEAPGELDLDRYRRELERRERVGRIGELLAEERWDLARKQLEELSPDDAQYGRLETLLAIGQARTAGAAALARELYRRWSDVVTYRGRDAYRLLEDGLEEAWRHGEREALRFLQEVARRAAHDEATGAEVRGRLADWLEWLQIERRLTGEITAAGLRRLVGYVEAPTSRELHRRCRALVECWREADHTVALAWAYRAFAALEPPLFPEVADPAAILTGQSNVAADEVFETLRERAELADEDLEAMRRRLAQAAAAWRDLDDFLDLLPRLSERPRPPQRFAEAEALVARLERTLATVAELEQSDLRRDGMASRWDGARLQLVQLLEEQKPSPVPVAAALLARLEPLGPLTRLQFDESQLRKAARRGASSAPEDLDEEGLFEALAEQVDGVAEQLRQARQEGGAMWRAVGRDYWADLPAAAGDLAAPPAQDTAGLPALVEHIKTLEEDERRFRGALAELDRGRPWVGASGSFDPRCHRDYLALYPEEPPRSRRVFRLFDRFVRTAAEQSAILEKSAGFLPAWITRYLEEGVP